MARFEIGLLSGWNLKLNLNMRGREKIICLLSMGILGFLAIPVYAVTYEELCQYDSKFCPRLRDSSDQPVKPLPEVVAVLKVLNPKIKEAAAEYGVDPRAVVGAILAENSLNVTKNRRDAKEFLYWAGLQGQYKALTGSMPSLGLGQIKPDVAQGVEEIVAKKEGRAARSLGQIAEALKNPYESLKYAAAIVRDGQDAYKARGFDISKDPALLTTVYNLGGAPTRADEAKAQNRMPRVNFFGFFVDENRGAIDEIVNFSPPTKEAVRPSPFISRGGVELLPYPPECDPRANASMHDYSRDKTYNRAESVGSGAGFYKVVSHGVDCDMKPWSMVQTSNGRLGWVNDEELQAKTTNLPAGGITCNKQAFDSCRKQIQQSMPGLTEAARDRSGALTFKLNRKDKAEPANIRTWRMECLSGETQAANPGRGTRGRRRFIGSGNEIQASDVPKLKEQIEKKRAELVAKFGAEVVDDKSSDLHEVLHTEKLDKCGTIYICAIDKQEFEEFLQADLSKAFTSYRDAKELSGKYSSVLTIQESWSLPLKEAVSEIEEQCKPIFSDFPALQAKWIKFKKDYAAEIEDPKRELEVQDARDSVQVCARIRGIRDNIDEDKMSIACKNQLLQASIGEQSKTRMSALMREMLSSKSDQEGFLNDGFGWLDSFGPMNRSGGEVGVPCNYDPGALTKDVEKLAQNSCIESVVVPDLSIAKKFTSQGSKRVLYSQFEDPEVYGVRIKGACDD